MGALDRRLEDELGQLAAWDERLKRAAAALVRDEHAGEDLAQDAWLAALQRGRPPEGSVSAWLMGTVRRAAAMHRRSRARRAARERAAARPEATDDAAGALARLETHAALLDEVRALPRDYRDVIVARYLEERSPAEIAEVAGLPVRTLETRLRRARALLRRNLDRRSGADRTRWFTGMFALPALQRRALMVLAMTKLQVVVAVVACAALGWLVSLAVERAATPVPGPNATRDAATVAFDPARTAELLGPAQEPSTSREPASVAFATGAARAEVATWLSGRVLDAEGRPLPGAHVHARPHPGFVHGAPPFAVPLAGAGWRPSADELARATTDAAGRFALEVVEGPLELAVRARGHAPLEVPWAYAPIEGGELGDFVLALGHRLRGQVVDAAGIVVASAEIHLAGEPTGGARERPRWRRAATTDAVGRFGLDEASHGPWTLRASAAGHLDATVSGVEPALGGQTIVVRLGESHAIAGRVVGTLPTGRIVARAVFAERAGMAANRPVEVDVDAAGRFRLAPLPTHGPWKIQAALWSEESTQRLRITPSVHVERADENEVELVVDEPRLVRARATNDVDGAPLAGAVLTVTWVRRQVGTASGSDGRTEAAAFGIDGRRSVRVEIGAPGFRTVEWSAGVDAGAHPVELGDVAMVPLEPLRVRLVDARTQVPIEGASVVAQHWKDPTDERTLPAAPAPKALRRSIATSDVDGCVALEPPALPFGLTAIAAGFAPGVRHVADDASREPLVLELGPGASVLARVTELGAAAIGVPVRAVRTGGSQWHLEQLEWLGASDERGEARFDGLPEGRYLVFAMDRRNPSVERALRVVEIETGTAEIRLELPPPTTLEGAVSIDGRPLSGARVLLRQERDRNPQPPVVVRTDPVGRFRLEGLVPAAATLELVHPHVPEGTEFALTLAPGANRFTHDVRPATLFGNAVDEEGAPIAGVELRLVRARAGRDPFDFGAAARTSTTDARGAFAFETLAPGVEWQLELGDPAHRAPDERFVLAPGEAKRLTDLVLRRAAALRVTTTYSGPGAPFLAVTLERDAVLASTTAQNPRDFEMTGLEPGRSTLRLWSGFRPPLGAEVASREVELVAGERLHVHFDLP